jgi:small ligand-binding sensory domain FIST
MGEQASGTMRIASAVSNVVGHPDTARNLVASVSKSLDAAHADLLVLLASPHFEAELPALVESLLESLRPRAFIGCTAEAVIAGEFEYEHQPAIMLWAAHLPRVNLASFHIYEESDLARLEDDAALREYLGVPAGVSPQFVLLGEPFSFGAATLTLLDRLEQAYPGRPAVGGMASAADVPNQNVLIFDGEPLRHGLVGVALWGDVIMDTVVSQGCRPIGRHLVITKSEENVIYQLGGRAPLQVATEIFQACDEKDRELIQNGLFVGRVINEYQPKFDRGDFLIRSFLGFDRNTGAMAIGELIRPGQTIQFHVRDSQSASEDLHSLLARPRSASRGALIFSCNGRGTRLFPARNHDAGALTGALAGVPIGGCFCAGEIGPIGSRNFLHGFTASVGLFRPATP